MTNLVFALACLVLQVKPEAKIETRFRELEPSCGPRAIILVHGLLPRLFSNENAAKELSPSWQTADSLMGRALSKHGSVFGFSYSQNVEVEKISKTLVPHVADLETWGFGEIVLVGFSAGGLIVRQFVEDNPDSGVTRVVQVCSPNGGTSWGRWSWAIRENQDPFVRSMTWEWRRAFLEERAARAIRIPHHVDFIVVMGTFIGFGDTLAARESQWPEGLRDQGIPVTSVSTIHCLAMRLTSCARVVSRLAATPQNRWTPDEVEEAREELID